MSSTLWCHHPEQCIPGFWDLTTLSSFCSCTDIDECADDTHGCSPYAYCTDTIGGYLCDCQFGYTGDGFRCSKSCYCVCTHLDHYDLTHLQIWCVCYGWSRVVSNGIWPTDIFNYQTPTNIRSCIQICYESPLLGGYYDMLLLGIIFFELCCGHIHECEITLLR